MPQNLQKYQSREDGFTLIELLIVVLIIGILAAIAIPVYLGIQAQGFKSVVKSDVNNSVKRVQVALTEGAQISDVKSNYASYGVKPSRQDEAVYMANSPSAGANANRDYQIVGSMDKNSTPNAAPINYTYSYDSYTGKFSESDTASTTPQIVLGSGTGTLPDGYTGSTYSAQIDATVTGGTGTTQYTITTGSLPTGLSLNQNTGAITGTPTVAGTNPITVTVTNGSLSNSRAYVLRVYTKPAISTTTLPAARLNQVYDQTLTATGSPAPAFAVTAGSLPTGLTLDTAIGRIYGTPTATGSSSFTITASNGGGSDSAAYTIAVNDAPAISTTSLAASKVGTAYSQNVSSSGYPSVTYSASNLPSGLTINSSTGAITGTPVKLSGNSYNVTVTADNGIGTPATKNLTLVNNEAPSVKLINARSNKVNGSYNDQLFNPGYTTGSTTFSVTSGSMPTGTSINSSGIMTGTVASNANQGEYWWTITATNSAGSISQSFNNVILDNTYAVANSGAFPDAANNGPALNTQQCGYWNSQADGCYQWVVSGVWFRTPASTGHGGYFLVYNVTRAVWASAGGYENGPYGWPIAAPVFNANGTVTQQFERGTITTASTGIPGSY